MTKQMQTIGLALTLLLLTIKTAFPVHFPPPAFTKATTILPDQLPTTAANPTALSSWNEETPSILLCQLPHFAGECLLLEDDAAQTCLNLDSNTGAVGGHNAAGTGSLGLEVGSMRIGGGRGCVLFG